MFLLLNYCGFWCFCSQTAHQRKALKRLPFCSRFIFKFLNSVSSSHNIWWFLLTDGEGPAEDGGVCVWRTTRNNSGETSCLAPSASIKCCFTHLNIGEQQFPVWGSKPFKGPKLKNTRVEMNQNFRLLYTKSSYLVLSFSFYSVKQITRYTVLTSTMF